MSFSPDGRFIACDVQAQQDGATRDIHLLATDTGREVPLVEHPADDRSPLWTPDGKRVLFASDRTGTFGIWTVNVTDGKPDGSPALVKADMGLIHPLGLAQDGSLYYAFPWKEEVYTATIDLDAGRIVAPPRSVSPRFVGANSRPAWSPDGRSLAYHTSRGDRGEPPLLSIRSLDSGTVRELSPQLGRIKNLRWASDGRSLLVAGVHPQKGEGAFRIDARTGAVAAFPGSEKELRSPAWSREGRTVFYVDTDPARYYRIVARDLKSGSDNELYRGDGGVSSLDLSPDGQLLAFAEANAATGSRVIRAIPTTGGAPRELCRMEPQGRFGIVMVRWTPDGRHLLFGWSTQEDSELWRVPAAGGEPRRLGAILANARHLTVHPDGKRISFHASIADGGAGVWVMENFLPSPAASAASGIPLPLAASATATLVSLPAEANAHGAAPRELSVRKLPSFRVDYDYYAEEFSPDGTKLALVEMGETALNIATYDLASGRTTPVTRFEKNLRKEWLWSPVWSPDGATLVFTREEYGGSGETRIVTIGQPSRVLYRDAGPSGSLLRPTDWLPDGSAIVAVRERRNKSHTLGLLPVAGGPFRPLRSLHPGKWTQPGDSRPLVSPDGRFILFEDGPAGRRNIYITATQGPSSAVLADHPADDTQPRWSPDGRHVVFLSRRHGRQALWGIAIENGRTKGNPFMIKEGMEDAQLLNWPARGAFCYRAAFEVFDLYTMPMDPATGTAAGRPRHIPYPRAGSNVTPAWSPDGRRLAFLSGAEARIVLLSPAGGSPREYPLPVDQVRKFLRLAWLPDGSALAFAGVDARERPTLFRLHLATGRWTRSLLPPGALKARATVAWNRDGKSYFTVVSPGNGRPDRIVEHTPATGRTRVVWTPVSPVTHIGELRLSPDFVRLAFRAETSGKPGAQPAGLMLLDRDTRQARMVTPTLKGSNLSYMWQNPPTWSPDGRFLVFQATGTATAELHVVPAAGGVVRRLDLGGTTPNSPPHWSPDGRQIAFAGRTFTDNYWVMEDFLPIPTARRASQR